MKIFLFLLKNNIHFELTKHKIQYTDDNNVPHLYTPDIEINGVIYEIKPTKFLSFPLNIIKLSALSKYCECNNLKWAVITENTYNLDFMNKEYVELMIEKNIVKIGDSPKNVEKFKRIFK